MDKALEFYKEYNHLEKALYEAYPQNVSFKNGLAISYERLGSIHTSLGNLDKALEFYKEYNHLKKALYEAYPQNVSFKNSLAISYAELGTFYQSTLKDYEIAQSYLKQSEVLFAELSEDFPHYQFFNQSVQVIREIQNEINISRTMNQSLQIKTNNFDNKKDTLRNNELTKNKQEEYIYLEDSLSKLYQEYLINPVFKNEVIQLSNAYGELAKKYLQNQYFEKAEEAAIKGRQLDSTNILINVYLTISFVYQGKKELADQILEQQKNIKNDSETTYTKLFLKELSELQANEKEIKEKSAQNDLMGFYLNQEKSKIIDDLVLKANFYATKYDIDSAEILYNKAIELNNTNTELLYSYSIFLSNQNLIQKAIEATLNTIKVIDSVEIQSFQHVNIFLSKNLNLLGILYASDFKYNLASDAFSRALNQYSSLTMDSLQSKQYYWSQKASILNNLGILNYDQGELVKAINYFNEAIEIRDTLVKVDTLNVEYKLNLADTYNELGSIFISYILQEKDAKEHAYNFLRKALDTYTSTDSTVYDYQYKKAIAYNSMGYFYEKTSDYSKAEDNYITCLRILQKLANNNTRQYELEVARNFMTLGLLHFSRFEEDNDDLASVKNAKNYFNHTAKLLNKIDHHTQLVNLLKKNVADYLIKIESLN